MTFKTLRYMLTRYIRKFCLILLVLIGAITFSTARAVAGENCLDDLAETAYRCCFGSAVSCPINSCMPLYRDIFLYIFHKNSILILDMTNLKVTQKTTRPMVPWGKYCTAVAGNKLVMGPGEQGNSILIVNPEAKTVTKKKGLSEASWGYESTAVAGNKLVMGPTDTPNPRLW